MRRIAPVLLILSSLAAAEGSGSGSGYSDAGGPSGAQTGNAMWGVQMSPPQADKAAQENIPAGNGVQVQQVYEGSAAAEMGVKPGDIVTELNGQPVTSMQQFRNIIQRSLVGEAVEVTIRRDGKDEKKVGFLGQWPQHIPMNPIDSKAEQRYRSMQEQALDRRRGEVAERQQMAAQLEQGNARLQNQAAAHQRFQQAAANPTQAARSDRPAAAAAGLHRVYTDAIVQRDPLRAASQPWILSYRLAVHDPAALAQTTSDEPATAAPVALPAATLPIRFRYRCEVSL